MPFTSYEYLAAMRNFLLTAPFSTPYNDLDMIDYGSIIQDKNSDQHGEGNAIMLTGDQIISRKRSVTGRETHDKRVNFALIFWRDTNDNVFQRDIAQFLIQLIQWINEEQAKRRTLAANPALPRFSMTEKETISADGGIMTAMLDETRSEFSIQIHVDYQMEYR